MSVIILLLISYLIGSIPFGYLCVYLYENQDIREYGSGNIGATNVYRKSGLWLALAVFILDGLKGLLIALVALKFGFSIKQQYLISYFAILGHCYSIFLNFKGGKAISTSIFVVSFFSYKLALIMLFCWIIIFLITKISSLASLLALFIGFFLSLFIETQEFTQFLFFVLILVVLKHKENIKRIVQNKESKII
jgi:glycerol-3-phosphate acyltransferase PlsY